MSELISKILKEAIAEPTPLPKFFFHATDEAGYLNTLRDGIKGKYGVFLADSYQNAAKFLWLRGNTEIYVFKIPTSKLDKTKIEESFDHDEDLFQCKAWVYDGVIPSNAINIEQTRVFKK